MSSNLEFSGELPLFPSGWGSGSLSYTSGEAFWAEIDRVTAAGGFGDSLDGAMQGKAAPRVWLFLHEPGHGKLSTTAALGFARHLVGRGQSVLVLDGDDEDSDLTRWSGREDEEGWLDVVRYGVSLQTAGIPLPFGGRPSYLLGVGSFTPTDATDAEIERVLSRLKRQADDLLVVAPVSSMGYKWAQVADLRLLCWDRSQKSEEAIDGIAEDFAGTDCPLTCLVGFGFPDNNLSVAMDGHKDLMFEKTETNSSDPDVDTVENDESKGFDEEFEKISTELTSQVENQETEEVLAPESEIATEPEVNEDPVWVGKIGTETESPAASITKSGDFIEYEASEPSSGSSKVFWFIGAVSVFVIAISTVFFFQYIRVQPDGNFAPVTSVASSSGSITPIPDVEVDAAAIANDENVISEDADPGPASITKDEAKPEEIVAEDEKVIEKPEVVVAAASSETDPEVETSTSPVVRREGFQMDPYLVPVGQEGYALHIYSFSDSVDALAQMRELELKGFQTAWRAVEIPEKGRYFRVFLGSFASKASARAAQDDLLNKLRQDWARVARF